MAVARRFSGPIQDALASNIGTVTWNIPAGVADGDLALFAVGSNTSTATFTPPTGWSVVGAPTVSNSAYTTAVYGKILTAAEAGSAVSVALSIAGRAHGGYIILSGAAGVPTVVQQASDTTAGSTIAAPNVIPGANNSFIVNFGMVRSSASSGPITVSVDAAGTEQAEGNTNFVAGSIPNFGCDVATRNALGSAGVATGAATFTSSDAGSTGQGWTIAVEPSTAPAVGTPLFVAAATPVTDATTATTVTIVPPAAAAVGNLAMIVFEGSEAWTNSAPLGWTRPCVAQSKAGISQDIWVKTLASGDMAGVTITSNNNVAYKRIVQMGVWSGAQVGNAQSSLETTTGTAHLTPPVTAANATALIIIGAADRASPGSSSFTIPNGFTQRWTSAGIGGGSVSGVAAGKTVAAAGAQGQFTISGTVSTPTAAMFAVVLEPLGAAVANTVDAGADIISEPRVQISRTAVFTGATPTGIQWTSTPAGLTLVGATTATVSFTTPPKIAAATYTQTATATYASGPPAVSDFKVTVLPVTRRAVLPDGTEVPLRAMQVT